MLYYNIYDIQCHLLLGITQFYNYLPKKVYPIVWTLSNIKIFYLIKTYINITKVIASNNYE